MKKLKTFESFLNENKSQGTPEEIINGKVSGGSLSSNDFKENMLVAPSMFYKSQDELKVRSGKVTKVEPEKITYYKGDGNTYTSSPSDLIIINGNFTK
jgi:hypothetical protein